MRSLARQQPETQPQAETTASEAFAETEPAEDPEDALPSLWRTHDASRWEPRTEEPFRGFQSPPGRFYRSERPKRRDI